MNRFIICVASLAVLFAYACNKKHTVMYSYNGKNPRPPVSSDTLWYLKNRVPDCDSALVFMKQSIRPLKSPPLLNRDAPRERQIFFSIPGVETPDDQYKYYLNPDCFLGRPVRTALEIFCLPDSLADFYRLDEKYRSSDQNWFLIAGGTGCTLFFVFKDGVVIRSEYQRVLIQY